MSARTLAALVVVTPLLGCPLPQPLPDYPAGTVTPPRILSASTTSAAESIIPVPAGCTSDVYLDLGARIFYQDSNTVEARWFVDYRKDAQSRYAIQNALREVPANPDPLVLERDVPGFRFHPYEFPPAPEIAMGSDPRAAGVTHVVELVVSNSFDPSDAAPEPNRTPATVAGVAFEIQSYRWVFVNVPPSAALPCPP